MLASFEWLDKALGAKVAIRELASGEELFSQGARARAIFALESGRLRLLRRTVDGHLVVLHRARAGELFAEAALFSETYHCDAVAAAPSRVRTYQKNDVLAALRAHPDLCERFLGVLAKSGSGASPAPGVPKHPLRSGTNSTVSLVGRRAGRAHGACGGGAARDRIGAGAIPRGVLPCPDRP